MKRAKSVALLATMLAVFHETGDVAYGATLTVTKTADTNDGVCDIDCSLREAIAAASHGDTTDIPAWTYTLSFPRKDSSE